MEINKKKVTFYIDKYYNYLNPNVYGQEIEGSLKRAAIRNIYNYCIEHPFEQFGSNSAEDNWCFDAKFYKFICFCQKVMIKC